MVSTVECRCGPGFSQNLFTILGMLLVLVLIVRFFSKNYLPEIWDEISQHIPHLSTASQEAPTTQPTQPTHSAEANERYYQESAASSAYGNQNTYPSDSELY